MSCGQFLHIADQGIQKLSSHGKGIPDSGQAVPEIRIFVNHTLGHIRQSQKAGCCILGIILHGGKGFVDHLGDSLVIGTTVLKYLADYLCGSGKAAAQALHALPGILKYIQSGLCTLSGLLQQGRCGIQNPLHGIHHIRKCCHGGSQPSQIIRAVLCISCKISDHGPCAVLIQIGGQGIHHIQSNLADRLCKDFVNLRPYGVRPFIRDLGCNGILLLVGIIDQTGVCHIIGKDCHHIFAECFRYDDRRIVFSGPHTFHCFLFVSEDPVHLLICPEA